MKWRGLTRCGGLKELWSGGASKRGGASVGPDKPKNWCLPGGEQRGKPGGVGQAEQCESNRTNEASLTKTIWLVTGGLGVGQAGKSP